MKKLIALVLTLSMICVLTACHRSEDDAVSYSPNLETDVFYNIGAETSFDFDGYTVVVKSISETFLLVQYELEVVYDEPQASEHNIEQFYTLIDQNGNEMGWVDTSVTLHDDQRTCTVVGSAKRISDDPLTELTFRLNHKMTIDQADTSEDMPAFTINFAE